MKTITARDLADIGQHVIMGDIESLEQILHRAKHEDKTKRPTVLQVWIASCAVMAIKKGDADTLNKLLDRFVGKVQVNLAIIPGQSSVALISDDQAREETRRITEDLSEYFDPKS